MVRTTVIASVLACAGLALNLTAAELPCTSDFREGTDGPAGWQLSGGTGRWVDRELLEVTGTGSDTNHWSSEFRCEPLRLYHFRMRARRPSGSGCVISGPEFANRDHYGLSGDWQWLGHVFCVPDQVTAARLRLGQWQATGAAQFDAVRVAPTMAVHRRAGAFVLGEGESIQDGVYSFVGDYGYPGSNYHRPLHHFTTGFNSDRWTFGGTSHVTYRFRTPGCRFKTGALGFNVNYHTHGGCVVEASRDGQSWKELAIQSALGIAVVERLPDDLLPADELFVRLRGATPDSSLQVNRLEFQGKLDPPPADARGETVFADRLDTSPTLVVEDCCLQKQTAGGPAELVMRTRNAGPRDSSVKLAFTVDGRGQEADPRSMTAQEITVAAGTASTFNLAIPALSPGPHALDVTLTPDGGPAAAKFALEMSVPEFYRADYGKCLEGVPGDTDVWWCESPWKVARSRAVPTQTSVAAELAAARNDFEAVQVVVRPQRKLTGLSATALPFSGSGGATIPASHVKILQVYYHFVQQPTDATGVRDWWPDALPPLSEPLDVAAGENQPLWVLVHVPSDARPGDYTGSVRLQAEGWSAEVPLRLHVWDLALPERNHLETAFGFSPGEAFRYHQARTETDKRQLLDLYFRSFAEHRISPYDPVPLDDIQVRFHTEAKPPRAEFDFTAFDRAFSRAVEDFRFTGYRLPVHGMGGGTFHSRQDPELAGFTENTPEYQALFANYVSQLEQHLREKNWLDKAYVYWFDEPDPKDYEFVTRGMERLQRHAPGLRKMLTEEPNDALAAPVDIWCPISNQYEPAAAERHRARGERFWWYVCTGPKAPYCTLFIDHPATELRVWLWQTWQRKVAGILVWESNYWTSSAAFPDAPQDPYADPMGYVSGYSTPRGVKRYWGNGDGRFIYPPRAARVPGAEGEQPVLAGPVSSIRWEMLREGIEDYEMLYLLRERLEARRGQLPADAVARYESLLVVPESITKDMTRFTTDPRPILQRRAEIAAAIESLRQP
jgi:hypothetical protein